MLGVSSNVDSWFKDVGEYGVKELYTRVSSHTSWIDQVMAADKAERVKLSSSVGLLKDGMTADNLPDICASINLKQL